MNKPKCSRILALLAASMAGIRFLLDLFAILFPEVFIMEFVNYIECMTLPMISTALFFIGAASILPFVVICAFNAFTASMSWVKSLVSLILSAVFWAGGTLCTYVFNMYATATANSTDGVAVASAIIKAQEFASHLDAIALALICSALAIELFLQKNHHPM